MKFFFVIFLIATFFKLSSEFFFEPFSQPTANSLEKTLLKPHVFPISTRPDIPLNTFYVSDEVSCYIDEVISLFKKHSINSDNFDWNEFENCFYNALKYCSYTWQTHPQMHGIVQWLGDRHTHFSTPSEFKSYFTEENYRLQLSNIKADILDHNVAYLKVPQTDCESGGYASKMRSLIRKLDETSPKLWILDLRGNSGGDFWEMLAGLSPLLNRGTFGFSGRKIENLDRWVHEPGKIKFKNFIVRSWDDSEPIHSPHPYIAILINLETASAGEAVAVAFSGSPKTKFFGIKTRGISTGIALRTLSDESVIGIASCYFFDKTKQIYMDGITPDVLITSEQPEDCLNEAINWLKSHDSSPPKTE